MLSDESCDFLHDAAARALEIACDSRKQKLYRLNRPLVVTFQVMKLPVEFIQNSVFVSFVIIFLQSVVSRRDRHGQLGESSTSTRYWYIYS